MSQLLARKARALDVEARREREQRCAADFLYAGDRSPRGTHASRCVFGAANACSRTYDPYADFTPPPDPRMYEGTGIGMLYGYGTANASQLAGWNVAKRRHAA